MAEDARGQAGPYYFFLMHRPIVCQ
jgi:hypothetical protein